MDTNVAPLLPPAPGESWHWFQLESVRDRINGAFNVLTLPGASVAATDVAEARGNMVGAQQDLDAMLGHDGSDDARAAAAELQPRVARAIADLERIGVAPNPDDVQSLLVECGDVLDRIEQVLAGAGWD